MAKKKKTSSPKAKRTNPAKRWLEKSRIAWLRRQIGGTRKALNKKWDDETFARLGKLERELAAIAK